MVQKRDNLTLDIIELLLKKNNHVRGIAKELNESHSTISRKLKKLKDENVVDSAIEGRNKIYFLKKNIFSRNYIFQTELHKLRKIMVTYPELSVLFEDIHKKTSQMLIILFGSYAKGIAKNESDIDIYIETKDKKIKQSIEEIHSKINVKIGPFDYSSPLIREIINNHVIIKGVEDYIEKQISPHVA